MRLKVWVLMAYWAIIAFTQAVAADSNTGTFELKVIHQPNFAANLYLAQGVHQPLVMVVLGGPSGGMRAA